MHEEIFGGDPPLFVSEIPFQVTPPDDEPRSGIIEWMPLRVVQTTTAAIATTVVVFISGAAVEAYVRGSDVRATAYAQKPNPFT